LIKILILHHTYILYVIHAIICILTDGNQIQIGFGFLNVNALIL